MSNETHFNNNWFDLIWFNLIWFDLIWVDIGGDGIQREPNSFTTFLYAKRITTEQPAVINFVLFDEIQSGERETSGDVVVVVKWITTTRRRRRRRRNTPFIDYLHSRVMSFSFCFVLFCLFEKGDFVLLNHFLILIMRNK